MAATNVGELYESASDKIKESMACFQMRGSNWRFKAIDKLDLNTIVYKPLRGSSYIPLPKVLANKKVIINMKNDDQECFKWCVTGALHPVQGHSERNTKRLQTQAEELCWRDVTFPMALKDSDTFEKNNGNISVNVFGYEQKVYP